MPTKMFLSVSCNTESLFFVPHYRDGLLRIEKELFANTAVSPLDFSDLEATKNIARELLLCWRAETFTVPLKRSKYYRNIELGNLVASTLNIVSYQHRNHVRRVILEDGCDFEVTCFNKMELTFEGSVVATASCSLEAV